MSSLPERLGAPAGVHYAVVRWIPVVLGLVALYVPTYVTLWEGVWQSEEQGHGPLILAVALWLVWQKRSSLLATSDGTAVFAWGALMLGLLFYAVGRSQDILIFEVGSQVPVLLATVALMSGHTAIRPFIFPVFFLVFLIPLPGFVVDALTNPLKRHVSEIAEALLYFVGYPIARSGVTLTIGPYQLLVADACSGLHSLFSLSALGVLYLYLVPGRVWFRNWLLAAAILPIAFGANIVRVIFLVLITYHLGDEAGQGFLHGFAGMVLFVAALVLIFAIDGLIGVATPRSEARG